MTKASKQSDCTSQLLNAAAQLFAHQGYHRTTTREIAHLAGVSENTLFRHFSRKEDLFWSALRSRLSGLKFQRSLLGGITETEAPKVIIPKIIHLFVETGTLRPETVRLISVAYLELHWKADDVCREYLSPLVSLIHRYIRVSIERGTMLNTDPTMATVALMMTVMGYPGLSKLISGQLSIHLDSQEIIKAHSQFWLSAFTPPDRGSGSVAPTT